MIQGGTYTVVANPGQMPIKEFLQSLGLLAGINAGALAVYLLFSFACRFYRDRLKGLLHLGAPELPPKTVTRVPLTLTGRQRESYERAEREAEGDEAEPVRPSGPRVVVLSQRFESR